MQKVIILNNKKRQMTNIIFMIESHAYAWSLLNVCRQQSTRSKNVWLAPALLWVPDS
jgi:hypothetical protein